MLMVRYKPHYTKKTYLSILEALNLTKPIFDKFFVHFDHENGLSPNKIVFWEFLLIYSQFSVIVETLIFSGRSRKNVKFLELILIDF